MAYAYLFCLLMEQISDHNYLIVIYQRNILIRTVYYLGHGQKSDSILRAMWIKDRRISQLGHKDRRCIELMNGSDTKRFLVGRLC